MRLGVLFSGVILFLSGSVASHRDVGGCPMFPADNPWNEDVSGLPVASNSDAIIATIGANTGLHADFGSGRYGGGPIGIPYNVVDGSTIPVKKWTHFTFQYADESDAGPYPVPKRPKPQVEYGSDRHLLLVDSSTCTLYELFDYKGKKAGSGAIWNLNSDELRPDGWTSADAAGLPILPGLARYDEVANGVIDHALRFTVVHSLKAHVWPARHDASNLTSGDYPPMGLRLRLKAGFDDSGFPPQAKVILEALKRYGMMVADNGSNWYISGAPDPGWSNDELHTLSQVKGSDFEVVDPAAIHP
jgi:hypothetical protein